MPETVDFSSFAHQGRTGYVISHVRDGIRNAALVAVDGDGKLHAAHVSIAADRLIDEADWIPLKTTEPGTWAHSMLSGQPSDALLDILSIPHVTRPAVSEKLFAEAARQAEEHLPSVSREALAAMSKAPDKRLSTYEFYADPGDRGLYRRQAAHAYPVFADLFNSGLKTKMAIDRGQKLADVLAPLLSDMAQMPVGNALLKRFSKAPALPEGMRLAPVVTFASHVQPDWFPSTEEEWQAFYHVAYALMEDLSVPVQSIQSVLKGSGGKWCDLVQRSLSQAYPDPDDPAFRTPNDHLRSSVSGARDTMEAFTDLVVLPLVAHAQEADDVYLNASIRKGALAWAWDMLFEGRNLPDILDISRRFHQERAGMMEHLSEQWRRENARAQVKEGGWPGLTEPVQAPNGLWLVPLCTPDELKEEGQRMHHCVGGYHSSSKSMGCHIVSVRTVRADGTSTSHSTCEFVGIKSAVPEKLSQRQHKAHHNRTPEAKYLDAIDWYARAIEGGRIKTNWDVIRAFMEGEEVIVGDQVERACGYDWRDRGNLDLAVRPWGQFVTKAYRTKGLDALMDSQQAADIIAGMTPAFLSASTATAPAPA